MVQFVVQFVVQFIMFRKNGGALCGAVYHLSWCSLCFLSVQFVLCYGAVYVVCGAVCGAVLGQTAPQTAPPPCSLFSQCVVS